ncbi:MAG: hypothetical protein SGJ10_05725 [Bacteroidota bacterium]|nr:hypothetical protein [Bacteroidota bacterium]
MKYIYISLIVTVLFTTCKTGKLDGPERVIRFGNGGGITGKVTGFKISSLGTLYAETLNNTTSPLKMKLRKKTLQEIFDLADSIQKNVPDFSNPGNMYYFISFGNNAETPNYTWGQNEFTVPSSIKRLYDILQKIAIKSTK